MTKTTKNLIVGGILVLVISTQCIARNETNGTNVGVGQMS